MFRREEIERSCIDKSNWLIGSRNDKGGRRGSIPGLNIIFGSMVGEILWILHGQ